MEPPRFRQRLLQEFQARQNKNPRYSLRAFANLLEIDHSTLSQIFRGTRALSEAKIRCWAGILKIDSEEVALYVALESALDVCDFDRQQLLRHWTAEAQAILNGNTHWRIMQLTRRNDFRADCRWIANCIGAEVDEVNIVLSRLLRLGLLYAAESGRWTDSAGLSELTETDFRKLALERIRERQTGISPSSKLNGENWRKGA